MVWPNDKKILSQIYSKFEKSRRRDNSNNFFKLYNLAITKGDKLNASQLVKMVYIRQFDTKCILLSLQGPKQRRK